MLGLAFDTLRDSMVRVFGHSSLLNNLDDRLPVVYIAFKLFAHEGGLQLLLGLVFTSTEH